MLFKAGIYTATLLIIYSALSSLNLAQNRVYSRNDPEIPSIILNNLNSEYRKVINLNGEWLVTSNDPVINAHISVPFCYEFNGKVTARREFNITLENPSEWNYIIQADGINYQCEININDKFVVKHEGGFTSFSSPITEGIIKNTNNVIEVKIDNTLDVSRTLPLKNTANFPKNYGGIYRDIYILAVPKIFVKSVNVFSEIDINMNADIKNILLISAADLSNFPLNGKNFTVKSDLIDTSGSIKASSSAVVINISSNTTVESENKFNLANPVYWSPEFPNLYKLQVTIMMGGDTIDVFKSNFGIYELTKKSGAITLNRSEFRFNGINYIEEYSAGLCSSYEEVERDVKNLKSLGCNIIKTYGKPAGPYLIDLCNRNGLLIMEELSVHTVPSVILDNENFQSLAEYQLNEMILSHKNNPCIFAYGLGNDFDVSGSDGKKFVKKLADYARTLDNRLIYYSTRNYREDICREFVDITGLNFYDGDLVNLKSMIPEVKVRKDKIFISNYGKVINPANLSGYSDPNSIESQSKFITDFFKLYKSSPFSGAFFHSYTDWNSDLPNLKYYDRPNQYMRTTGLYTLFREQRPPAVIMRKHFNNEDIPNLNIGTYTKEAPMFFVVIGLFTLILFVYLANSVRRFRENVNRALFRPFIFFTDVREQILIPIFHNLLLAVILSIGSGLFFANLVYYWKDSQLTDIMLTVLIPADNLKMFIDIVIVNPVYLTILFTVLTFLKLFLISLVIWIFSLTIKYRVGFGSIYTVTVWGMLPTVLLLAVGIFYIRILNAYPEFVLIGLGLAAILNIISVYRILNGTYIIFDVYMIKVYAYGILTIVFIFAGWWFYLSTSRMFFDYFSLVMLFLKN